MDAHFGLRNHLMVWVFLQFFHLFVIPSSLSGEHLRSVMTHDWISTIPVSYFAQVNVWHQNESHSKLFITMTVITLLWQYLWVIICFSNAHNSLHIVC